MKIGFKGIVGIEHGHIGSDFIKEFLLVLKCYLLSTGFFFFLFQIVFSLQFIIVLFN